MTSQLKRTPRIGTCTCTTEPPGEHEVTLRTLRTTTDEITHAEKKGTPQTNTTKLTAASVVHNIRTLINRVSWQLSSVATTKIY